jgi:Asp-tRNA(Asn)/Glu-tRNA(Gln) amidotransferase A subunit family amidase
VNDLVWKPVSELAHLIASKEVSPVEVVQAYLDRIAAADGKLRAYLTVTAEAAMAAAREAESAVMAGGPLGALHGVPIALKDLYCTRPGRMGAGVGRHGGVAAP